MFRSINVFFAVIIFIHSVRAQATADSATITHHIGILSGFSWVAFQDQSISRDVFKSGAISLANNYGLSFSSAGTATACRFELYWITFRLGSPASYQEDTYSNLLDISGCFKRRVLGLLKNAVTVSISGALHTVYSEYSPPNNSTISTAKCLTSLEAGLSAEATAFRRHRVSASVHLPIVTGLLYTRNISYYSSVGRQIGAINQLTVLDAEAAYEWAVFPLCNIRLAYLFTFQNYMADKDRVQSGIERLCLELLVKI